jgi:methionyl-tRNA formyltransferase
MGSGTLGLPTLEILVSHPRVHLTCVVTAPARPVGRRRVISPTPVASRGAELSATVLTPERLRAPEVLAGLSELDPELIILADYGRLVPRSMLALARHGALNLHPSLLPRHRGASPIPATILAGDERTGVTLIRMDEGLDTGPIVAQEAVPVPPDAEAPGLSSLLAELGAALVSRTLGHWLDGAIAPRPQPSLGATMTRPLRKEDGRLDPARPAVELERQVRAYRPWPGSWIRTVAGRIIVDRASVDHRSGGASPPVVAGTLLIDDGGELALVTGRGRLILHEVTPAGGRPMRGPELVRGRPQLPGSRVPS